jgi:hypothetical protein
VGADVGELTAAVAARHTEIAPFVGRDLSNVLTGDATEGSADAPVYFMTEDRILSGLRETGLISGQPFEPITGNASIETVVARVPGTDARDPHLWKLNHYYDADPRAEQDDGDVVYELFDLTTDPEERVNRARDEASFAAAHALLESERDAKRLTPLHTNARG